MDFSTSVKNTSGSLANLMALTGCEYCTEGDGLTTCWQRIKGLQSDINRVTTEKDSLNAQLEILKIENRGLVSRLRDRDTLVQNLNKTIDHLQEQNNRSSEEVGLRNRIQEELDHTKHVLREVHRLLAEDTDENSDSLELKRTKGMDGPILPDSVVTMLRSVMDKKQLQIHDYQLNIENERQQFAELNRTIATLSCEREALQQDLQALRQDFTVTSQRCEELSKQRDSCNSILESTTKGKLEVSENCRKLMKDLENLRREKASFQLSVTGLSLEKSQWIEEKESLQSQIRRVKSDCAQLESQNTTLREACEDLKHGLAQARAEIQRMSIDRNLIEGQKKDLALNLQNCEKKKLELESDISRYKSEIQLLRDQITRFEQTNLSLSKEKSHIEQLLKEAETEKVSIEHILDELKADFSAVKEELVKTERARSQLEIRYDTLQETLQMTEVDRDKYLSDLQDAEKVKEELSTQLIIAEREKSQNLADLEARSVLSGGFEQEIGRLKIERTGLEAKIRQLETKLATTEDSLKSQQDINGSISSTRQQIELSLYAAQSEIDSLQEKVNRLQGQVEETNQEKNQLRFQLTSAERSNEARFGNARKEIEELTELISKRNDELKKLTHEKDSISLSLVKEKEKLCQSFESQLIDLRHRFNRDKEDMMSTQTEELRHLRQQMSLQARKFDENLEAAELDKQQSLKFARSEQQAIETRLQKALTELEVSRAEVMKVRSESANRTSSDRLAMTNLRNELNKLQDELVQESSRHAEEISILEKKHTDALQALELAQSEATQLKCSVQSALLKNESTLEKMAELERQLEEALDREQSLKVELQKIQNQLSATVKENDSILSSNQELKAQIRDLGSEGNELQGTIDEQRHKISLLEDTKLKLEEELNIARNMMNVAEKRIIETETTFSENNRSIGSLKAKLQNLYNDLETNEARLQAEKSRSELAETQVNELNDQLKGALNKCDNLERDVLSIRRALALRDDSYKSQEEELRRKMQELAAKVKRLEDEKNNLELKFGTNVEEISQLSQKLRTAEERCETMQALSKKLEEQKNDIALRLASVMSSLKKVTGVTDKLNIDKHPPSPIRRLAQFKSAVIASEGISGRSSESIKDIDTESVNSTMRDLVMQSAKLEKERDDSISNNQILERKVGELNEKISQSEETIIQLKNALGKANCEHKTLQQHISSLENTLKEKESSEAMKTQMVTTSEEKLQVLEGKQRALLEEKGTLEDALNKVKLKLVQNEYEIRRLNQQIEAAQFKLNKSETGRKSLEQELNRVQKLLRDKEMEYQALQSKSECLQQNIVRLQERCDTLQSQVDKLQASEEIYKNRELNLKEQLTRLNVSASQENSALSQLKEQTLEYQRQLTSMEAEKRVTEERLEMMRSGNSELRRENSHLHEVIASLKTEVSSLKTKVVVLEGEAKNTQLNLQSNQERTGMVESDTMQRLQKSVREKQDLQERVNILTRQLSQVEKEKWDIARQSCSSKFDINRVGSEEENFLVQSLRREIARMADRFREMERDHTASFEEMRKRHKQERMRDAERMRELQISAQRQAEARERALKTRTEALERQVHYLRMQLEKDASMSDLKNVVKNSLRTVASEPRLDSDLFKREISKLDNALSRHLSSSNMPS
ncbi:rootletin-like isoform X2 [Artemia franciscana]